MLELVVKRGQATPADEAVETATADTTTGVEMPKELEEVKVPTETKVEVETSQVTTADETATADTTPAVEMSKELEASKVGNSASEFKMVLDKTTGRKLGMKVSKKDGVTLQITEVTGDLVGQWNDEHPELAVSRGDSIVEVNGVVNDAAKLSEECKHNKMLELVVKRGQATPADEAVETATADTTTGVEVPKELEEVKVPTETKVDAETPQATTADETATADTTPAVEMPKELEEVKGPTETKVDVETSQVTTVEETVDVASWPT